jgi:ABC-type amino acid transport substrate-binding protein
LNGCKEQKQTASTEQQVKAEAPASQQAPEESGPELVTSLPPELVAKVFESWSGDLDGMTKRRVIRALVVYNKTTYFLDKATQHGIAYDAMKEFETILNKKLNLGKLGVQVVFIPVSRDQLLPGLAQGKGDIAIGTLTVTPERLKIVDFTEPLYKDSSEIVVTGPGAPESS